MLDELTTYFEPSSKRSIKSCIEDILSGITMVEFRRNYCKDGELKSFFIKTADNEYICLKQDYLSLRRRVQTDNGFEWAVVLDGWNSKIPPEDALILFTHIEDYLQTSIYDFTYGSFEYEK